MQHLLIIEKKMRHFFFRRSKFKFLLGALSKHYLRNTSRLKLIWFKFREICVFYRKVIQLFVRCKKMQHS